MEEDADRGSVQWALSLGWIFIPLPKWFQSEKELEELQQPVASGLDT
jgi:hypothetical protein